MFVVQLWLFGCAGYLCLLKYPSNAVSNQKSHFHITIQIKYRPVNKNRALNVLLFNPPIPTKPLQFAVAFSLSCIKCYMLFPLSPSINNKPHVSASSLMLLLSPQDFRVSVLRTGSEIVHVQLVTCWFNPLNAELNPICHLLALLGAHHILHVSRIRVNIITVGKL